MIIDEGSNLIVVILSLIYFKRISAVYHPFIYLTWVGLANNIVSYFSGLYLRTNALNSCIYLLLASFLVLWQFRRWKILSNTRIYRSMQVGACILWLIDSLFIAAYGESYKTVWLVESIFKNGFNDFNSIYNVISSFLAVLLSIHMINRTIVRERESLLRNPAFLICCGFIFFFAYVVLVEIFYLYSMYISAMETGMDIFHIVAYVNLICNIIFAYSMLWMRKREAFTLQY